MKRFIRPLTAAFVCTASIVLPELNVMPAGASSNTTHLLNAWKALQADFNKVQAAVNSNNTTNAEAGFIAYSRDCVYLATFETSFNTTINSDIFSIAVNGNAWAWTGFLTVADNLSATNFVTASTRLAGNINKFNRDLTAIGLQ